MTEIRRNFLCLMFAIIFLVGCQSVPQTTTPTSERPSLADLDKVPRIAPKEVKALLDAGVKLMFVDTRSREEYDEEHIQGAVFLADVEARTNELAKDTKFVLY